MNRTHLFRHLPTQEIVPLLLLGTAVACLANSLERVVSGARFGSILPLSLLAAVLGWGLGKSRVNGWLAAVGVLLFGGSALWVWAARLDGILLELVKSSFEALVAQVIYWRGGPNPDFSPLAQAAATLSEQSGMFWGRTLTWLLGLQRNVMINDPRVRLLAWALAAWLVSAWAGWALRRREALAALTPLLVALGLVTSYTGLGISAFWLLAVTTVALMGLMRYNTNLRHWRGAQIDYAEIITFDTVVTLVGVTMLLGVLAWVLPAVSVKDLLENLRRQANENTAPQTLGLEQKPQEGPPVTYSWGSLPQQQLINAGANLSDEVVFTVRTGEIPPLPVEGPNVNPPNHHWRSRTYDIYTGRGWLAGEVENRTHTTNEALFTNLPLGYRRLTQEVTINFKGERNLYWAGALYRLDQPVEASWRIPPRLTAPQADLPFNGSDLFGALRDAPVYTAESYLPIFTVEQLRAAGTDYPESITDHYLELPESVSERVRALARQVTREAATPYDQAAALETYLREHYTYTLDLPTPPLEVEVSDYFLFTLRQGYCDYYATAMVVMARSVGLPARMVTGYASGKYDMFQGLYLVTAADAHAWVEVYFPGLGWIEFEPTSAQPSLNRPLPGSQEASQNAVLPAPPGPQQLVRALAGLSPVLRWSLASLGGLALLGLVCLGLENFILQWLRPARALGWIFRDLYRVGGRLTGAPAPGTTASEYALTLQPYLPEPAALRSLTELYLQALFAPAPVSRRQVRAAIKNWRVIRGRLLFTRRRAEKLPRKRS